MSSTLPSVSIGVVTHERAAAFSKLLNYLKPVFTGYGGTCELIVANNSGPAARGKIESIVDGSGIRQAVSCNVIDSPENNIAVGRNIIVDATTGELIAFIDDDEYPSPNWLVSLVDARGEFQCPIVAGPIIPVYTDSAKAWVRLVDIHNTENLTSGQKIKYAASGNFLIEKKVLGAIRFDPAYGKSGGEDTELFLRLHDRGLVMRWCNEAIVYEDIPPEKSSVKYMLRRFVSQGAIYKNIMTARGDIDSQVLFTFKALLLSLFSMTLGMILIVLRHKRAGRWIKRGFSNLGKIYKPGKQLYE